MPDASGWPLATDVVSKLQVVAPDGLTEELSKEIAPILASVIAHFESPIGVRGTGGTGRSFTPRQETRSYDGTGYSEIVIDDVVVGQVVAVSIWNTPVTDFIVKSYRRGLGSNILARNPSSSFGVFDFTPGVWPTGEQNVAVTATFGYAATVPIDVYEAVRCETCYRALVQGVVALDGLGEKIKIGQFELDTNPAAPFFGVTSPLPVFHATYLEAINTYRASENSQTKSLAWRMS